MARTESVDMTILSKQVSDSVTANEADPLRPLKSICDGIAAVWGNACEVVLHDFQDLEHSVVHVSGNITGRVVGSPLTDLGLQVLTSGSSEQDVLLYYSKAPDGSLMKCVSILLRNGPDGVLSGAVCINIKIDQLQRMRELINEIISIPEDDIVEEHYPNQPFELITDLVNKYASYRGWLTANLSREQRLDIIHYLDTHGVFAYRSAPSLVAGVLGVSRYTVYNYLKHVRNK